MPAPSTIKLAAFLAHAGIAARRKSEELIKAGKVKVNGQLEDNVARRVDPDKDVVSYLGQDLNLTGERIILALHKPRGYVSTVSDPDGKKTVMDLVPQRYQKFRLFPIGRLDEDSEGLILLTNDGQYAQKLTHPKFGVSKTYIVTIGGHLTSVEESRIRGGVRLKGERIRGAELEVIDEKEGQQTVELTLWEGKYHEIRRMMKALNHPVMKLLRVRMGPFILGDLRRGLTREETFLDPTPAPETSEDDSLVIE